MLGSSYAIPVYRISLVRESRMKVEQSQFRSSVQVAGMLRGYLEGAGCDDELKMENWIVTMP